MKKHTKTNFIMLSLMSLLLTSACTSAPYTNRYQFIMTSENQETVLGMKAWDQVKKDNKISTDKDYNSALKRVATNITNNIESKNYKWEFAVIDAPIANAFCLPGGKIAVYSGFFSILSNDAELAAIVGHEIAHSLARHAGERMSQQDLTQIGSQTLSQVLSQQNIPVPIPWMQVFGIASKYGVLLPYSRTQEYEADYIGMVLMAKGGYNPKAAVDFWERYSKMSNYDSITEFFMTHPMGGKRLQELKEDIPAVMKYYNEAKIKHGLGEKYNFSPIEQ